jgi:hypothetical protein
MYRSLQIPLLVTSFAMSLGFSPALANAQEEPLKTEDSASPKPAEQPTDVSPPPSPPGVNPPPLPEAPVAPASPPAPNAPPLKSMNEPVSVPPPQAPAPIAPPAKPTTRSIRIGPSLQVQLFDPYPFEKVSNIGTGLFGAYEFYLKPSFAIGINLSYRYHPGNAHLHQIGYGLLLKHYLGGTSNPDSVFMPFVAYGLLLQINMISTRTGSGTAHDTRLSAGTDIRIAGKIFFIEGAWHYSRLSLFEKKSEQLDNLEFDIGYRYPW